MALYILPFFWCLLCFSPAVLFGYKYQRNFVSVYSLPHFIHAVQSHFIHCGNSETTFYRAASGNNPVSIALQQGEVFCLELADMDLRPKSHPIRLKEKRNRGQQRSWLTSLHSVLGRGEGGTPRNSQWGCAARFSKS